ncbi:MAG: hypothetical protein VZR00_02140 [Lachnospiraceae bacterium]|jgi:hypothetical protein|nr:hypothetical protein [Lachnospiraceae bacterium]MEE3460675.1 hypothetical protein [Lachnospiraceae bacterium]
MRKKVLSVLLCTAMTAAMLTGCGGSDSSSSTATSASSSTSSTEATSSSTASSTDTSAAAATSAPPENVVSGDADAEDAFVVWGWNDDIKNIIEGVYKADSANADDYKRIVFVNTGGSDYYQTKIDEMLNDTSNKLYPDVMGLEVDYVLKYVNSDYLLPVSDLGITADDYKNMYKYTLDLGTDADGNVKALFWQATPGSYQVRADLAKKYLGTTDPKELQDQYFSDWDKVIAAAKKVNDASKGKCKLFSGYSDVFRTFSNSRTTGWYDDNDKITIDPNMEQYMDVAKQLYEGDLTFNTDQWSADWNANMTGDGESSNAALCYPGCPWFTYWCLNADVWTNNTILVNGPQQFYWGGTGLAATVGCADKELAGRFIKWITCNTDAMVSINGQNSDFVNNTEAVKKITANPPECPLLFKKAKQNIMEFYLPLADGIDASTSTAEDQNINAAWDTQVAEFVKGNKDKDTAIADFKAAVHDQYDYLS